MVSIASFSTPAFTAPPIQKNAVFLHVFVFLKFFSSIFPGGSADPVCPYVRTPMSWSCSCLVVSATRSASTRSLSVCATRSTACRCSLSSGRSSSRVAPVRRSIGRRAGVHPDPLLQQLVVSLLPLHRLLRQLPPRARPARLPPPARTPLRPLLVGNRRPQTPPPPVQGRIKTQLGLMLPQWRRVD